jgi:hypothetical protein
MYLTELYILNILLKKKYYSKYIDLIDIKYIKDVYKELYYLYEALNKLHISTERDLSLVELKAYFFSLYPDADQASYIELFTRLEAEQVGDDVAEQMVKDIGRRKAAISLSEALFQASQGRPLDDKAKQLLGSFLNEKDDHAATNSELNLVTTDLEVLLHDTYQVQGARWRLNCLNKSLGSLRPGDFGFIFARPETGKTTFLMSEEAYMLSQGFKVVHFNNEEQGNKVMIRLYQAYFGVATDVLLANVKKFKEAFAAQVGKNFLLYDSASISKREVEDVVNGEEPNIVVYDQLPKIKGFQNDREDLRLGAIYQWGRELAKGRHAAIGVCQADGTAENVRYLTMEHVANAKTAVQAEADFIVGIGKTHDPMFENVRYLNISKNKLLGDEDSMPTLKHGRFETIINPTIARYEDIITYG